MNTNENTTLQPPAKRQCRRMTQEEYDAWEATLDSQPSRGEDDWWVTSFVDDSTISLEPSDAFSEVQEANLVIEVIEVVNDDQSEAQ